MKTFLRNEIFSTGTILAMLVLVMMAGSAYSSSLKVQVEGQIADWNHQYGDGLSISIVDYSSTGPLSKSIDGSYPGGGFVNASAVADYGTLSAYAYKKGAYPFTAVSDATAQFTDRWTIGQPSLTGQRGTLRVWVDIDGTIQGRFLHPAVSDGSGWSVRFTDNQYSEVSSWDYSTNSGRESYSGYLYKDLDFIYGQPFSIGMDFAVVAGGWSQSEALADYGHTMKMDMGKSQILDAAGAVVSNYTLITESGHDYLPASPSAVPEPGTMLLVGGGLVGFVFFRKKLS